HVLQVRAGVEPGADAERGQQGGHHAGAGGLAVGAGQVHRGRGLLRMVEQLGEVLDALQARPELARHAGVQGLDGFAVLHADVLLPYRNGRWPLRRPMRCSGPPPYSSSASWASTVALAWSTSASRARALSTTAAGAFSTKAGLASLPTARLRSLSSVASSRRSRSRSSSRSSRTARGRYSSGTAP